MLRARYRHGGERAPGFVVAEILGALAAAALAAWLLAPAQATTDKSP